MRLLGEVSDETILRLVHLLGGLPDDDVLELVEALSRLSPGAAEAGDEADVGGRPDRRPLGASFRGPSDPGMTPCDNPHRARRPAGSNGRGPRGQHGRQARAPSPEPHST